MKDRVGIAESEGAPAPEVGRPSTARRFRELLADLGPTFIKMGQVLSTRADILPAEYVEELSHLQDAASPIPVETVRREIARGLGRPWDEAFASTPALTSLVNSLAPGHTAYLREKWGYKVLQVTSRAQIPYSSAIAADIEVVTSYGGAQGQPNSQTKIIDVLKSAKVRVNPEYGLWASTLPSPYAPQVLPPGSKP